jgi:hypothetical protein
VSATGHDLGVQQLQLIGKGEVERQMDQHGLQAIGGGAVT